MATRYNSYGRDNLRAFLELGFSRNLGPNAGNSVGKIKDALLQRFDRLYDTLILTPLKTRPDSLILDRVEDEDISTQSTSVDIKRTEIRFSDDIISQRFYLLFTQLSNVAIFSSAYFGVLDGNITNANAIKDLTDPLTFIKLSETGIWKKMCRIQKTYAGNKGILPRGQEQENNLLGQAFEKVLKDVAKEGPNAIEVTIW